MSSPTIHTTGSKDTSCPGLVSSSSSQQRAQASARAAAHASHQRRLGLGLGLGLSLPLLAALAAAFALHVRRRRAARGTWDRTLATARPFDAAPLMRENDAASPVSSKHPTSPRSPAAAAEGTAPAAAPQEPDLVIQHRDAGAARVVHELPPAYATLSTATPDQ